MYSRAVLRGVTLRTALFVLGKTKDPGGSAPNPARGTPLDPLYPKLRFGQGDGAAMRKEAESMESKKKWIWISAAIVAAVFGWIVYQRQGVPMIEQGSLREIIYVWDYRQGYEDMVDVTERIDGEKLAGLLETYQRRRGGPSITSFWIGDVQIDMFIRTTDDFYEVILGNDNRVSDGEKQYEIIDSDAILQEVLALIDGEDV